MNKLLLTVRKVFAWPALKLIRFYKICISPYLGNHCRYTPTCSQYAYEAISKYGIFKGGWAAFCAVTPGAAAATTRYLDNRLRPVFFVCFRPNPSRLEDYVQEIGVERAVCLLEVDETFYGGDLFAVDRGLDALGIAGILALLHVFFPPGDYLVDIIVAEDHRAFELIFDGLLQRLPGDG